MRIKFTEDVPVEISTVPSQAFGAIGIRHAKRSPKFAVTGQQVVSDRQGGMVTLPRGTAEMTSEPPVSMHYFRKGWAAELPDAMATPYITAGQAVAVETVRIVSADEFSQWDGMYSRADLELLQAGVIVGYEEGSTPSQPRYRPGPNWDAWNASRLEAQ